MLSRFDGKTRIPLRVLAKGAKARGSLPPRFLSSRLRVFPWARAKVVRKASEKCDSSAVAVVCDPPLLIGGSVIPLFLIIQIFSLKGCNCEPASNKDLVFSLDWLSLTVWLPLPELKPFLAQFIDLDTLEDTGHGGIGFSQLFRGKRGFQLYANPVNIKEGDKTYCSLRFRYVPACGRAG